MFCFRRFALVLVLGVCAAGISTAQEPSPSSNAGAAQPDQAQPPAAQSSQGIQSVQDRIRARREQRRAQAMHDVYSHPYELNVGMGYSRFVPGDGLQRTTFYAWNVALTRFYSQRFGVTADARGNYGTTFVGLNPYNVTKPSISTYTGMIGPTYRFYMQPKYAFGARVVGGIAHGNFSGDTIGFGSTTLGMWPDGYTFAANAAVYGEYNLSPSLGLRLAPEYYFTGFGSTIQASRGFTAGFVFRFGKQ